MKGAPDFAAARSMSPSNALNPRCRQMACRASESRRIGIQSQADDFSRQIHERRIAEAVGLERLQVRVEHGRVGQRRLGQSGGGRLQRRGEPPGRRRGPGVGEGASA